MNKKQLVKVCSDKACVNINDTNFIFDVFLDVIKKSLVSGRKVTLSGFGTFEPVDKKARRGYSPKTGEQIFIPPKKGIRFKPSPKLLEKMNEK